MVGSILALILFPDNLNIFQHMQQINFIRYAWISLLLSLLPAWIHAQGREFGIRAGIQGAWTYNQEGLVEDGINFMYGGVFLGRPLGSTFFASVISGLEYHQNGYYTDADNLRRLHYLGLPLAIRLHFGPWHLQPGISANFKVYEQLFIGGEDVLNQDNRSSFFDLPLQIGAGVRIIDVILEARFHYGWLDIYQGNKNAYLQLGAAYSF
jgi:hypothetical protein